MSNNRSKNLQRVTIVITFVVAVSIFSLASSTKSTVFAADNPRFHEVWRVSLSKELQGRIYETAIFFDPSPLVIATSPESLLRIDGDVQVLANFKRDDRSGETAILPSPGVLTSLQETRIGVLVHDHHAVARFKLVTPEGTLISVLEDPRHFHYRLAPDGRTFVGIDAHGKHAALAAKRLTYRFYNENAELIREIDSESPQPNDSAYTPDGKGFLINSKEAGLTMYASNTGEPIWNIPAQFDSFAAANVDSSQVITTRANMRVGFQIYRAGKPLPQAPMDFEGPRQNTRNLAISPNGSIAASSNATELIIFGADAEATAAIFRIDDGLTINSVAISDRGYVALGAQQKNVQGNDSATGKVVVLNTNGETVYEQVTQHERSNAWIPTVQFDASGRLLLIRTMENLYLLEII